MLKTLAILTLSLSLIPFQAHAQTGEGEQRKNGEKPAAPVTPLSVQQKNSPSPQPVTDNHVPADVRIVQGPSKDSYDKAVVWINGLLALIGIGGIGIGIGTLIFLRSQVTEMRRQATLLQQQTEAAARNTQAFINKERPRLFLSTVTISEDFQFEVFTTNRGQSPALVTYKFVGCELLKPDTESLRSIPHYTEWGEPAADYVADDWVLPKARTRVGGYDASWVYASGNEYLQSEVMEGKLVLWYFGILIYQDTVSADEHTVRFCYRCHPSERGNHWLTEDGPPAYRGET